MPSNQADHQRRSVLAIELQVCGPSIKVVIHVLNRAQGKAPQRQSLKWTRSQNKAPEVEEAPIRQVKTWSGLPEWNLD